MHEMTITENLVRIVAETAEVNSVAHVLTVHLRVGKLRQVIPETLRFCFDVLAKGTVAENASLVIEEVPVTIRCRQCSRESEINEHLFMCSHCGTGDVEMLSGKELFISSLECNEVQQ